jgi:pilus assembly protein CpaB
MILRFALFALMAFGLLGFGVVAWVATHPAPPEGPPQPVQIAIVVLSHDVRAGSLLRSEDLASKPLPPTQTPDGALKDSVDARRELVGGMVRHSLSTGDVLRATDVMRPGDHGFLAAVLQPGMRAVTVGVDAVSGTAGLIWPGDHVDVILTQTMDDASLPVGRRVAAETVLQNVRVIAIDRLLVQGAADSATPDAQGARTVTLEVTEEQAERVEVAGRIGRLSLTVRAAEQTAAQTLPADTPPIWAADVSRALVGRPPPPPVPGPAPNMLRVFQGAGDGREYRF